MKGPAPTPTAVKIARGNPGKRPLNENEPRPPADDGDLPKGLKGRARRKWKELVPILKQMGVWTSIDRDALVLYCDTWVAREEVTERLSGLQSDGSVEWNRVANYRLALEKLLCHLNSLFGMNPASRSRIQASKPATVDPVEEKFFNRGKPRLVGA